MNEYFMLNLIIVILLAVVAYLWFHLRKPVYLKYAMHPGFVTSQSDGQTHYINTYILASLYELKPDEWIEWNDLRAESYLGLKFSDYFHLYPSNEGNYGRPRKI